MNILKTALRTVGLMWPLFVTLAAVGIILGEYSSSSTSLAGGYIIIYSMTISMVHRTIISGEFNFVSSGGTAADKNPYFSWKFLRLVFFVIWLPALAGVAVSVILIIRTDPKASSEFLLLLFPSLFMWMSLTFNGISIPRHVWCDLHDGRVLENSGTRGVRMYIGGRLLFWNVAFTVALFLFVMALEVSVGSFLGGSNSYADIAIAFVGEALSFGSIILTPAILSHGHLRAYNLGPQGLVSDP